MDTEIRRCRVFILIVLPHFPPLFTSNIARVLLEGQNQVSLDLGLSTVYVGVEGSAYLLPGGLSISQGDLELVASRDNAVFFVSGKGIFQAAVSGGHFWKLVPTYGAPTLEIDGIRMHRTKDTTPDADARVKVHAMGLEGGRVLDTCGGLGYTASEAVQRGADLVLSVERSPEVLQLARLNPWSRGLFYGGRQNLVLGDSYDLCGVFSSASSIILFMTRRGFPVLESSMALSSTSSFSDC